MKKILLILLVVSYSAGAQFNVLGNFNNAGIDPNGANPDGSLTVSVTGDTLFGMTPYGGKFGFGSIFYTISNGSGYDTLYSFTDANDGAYPQGSLALSGKSLYGMTEQGGINGAGTIFSINTNGSSFDTLHSFGWGIDNGAGNPKGSLTVSPSGNTLYGMTYDGGIGSVFYGSIFSINKNGTGYDTLHTFTGNANDGEYPYGNVTLSVTGDTLYGMTEAGGIFNEGVIYSINKNGSGFDTLHSFGYYSQGIDGTHPDGSLTLYQGALYGLTNGGGQYGAGVIFSLNENGTGYGTLHYFGSSATDGGAPAGSLIVSPAGGFYGMAPYGGVYNNGTLFTITANGSGYDTLFSFYSANDGANPQYNNLALFGNTLFGMAPNGGGAGNGTVFKFGLPVTPLIITDSITSNVSCYGESNGEATAYPSGGISPYTYFWSNGSTTVSTNNPTGNVLNAGTYTVTVTDNVGFSATASVTITEPTALTDGAPIVSKNVRCYGGANGRATAATPSGGTSPYIYSWNGGATSTSATDSHLSSGTYTVTITDANGCTVNSSGTATITEPTALIVTTDSTADNGTGDGTAGVMVNGGSPPYTYIWSSSASSQTTPTVTGLTSGAYTCVIFDSNFCNKIVTITVPPATGIQTISNSPSISIYPNPSSGMFTFQSSLRGTKQSLEIYNVLGEKVYSNYQITKSSNYQIDLSTQPNGVYMYRVTTDTGSLVGEGKLIIQK